MEYSSSLNRYLKDIKSLLLMSDNAQITERVAKHLYDYPEKDFVESVRIWRLTDGEAELVHTIGRKIYDEGYRIPSHYGPILRARSDKGAVITPESPDYDPQIEGGSKYYALLYLQPDTLISVELAPTTIGDKEKAEAAVESLANRFISSLKEVNVDTVMEHARKVQDDLVPAEIKFDGYDIAYAYEPSRAAGGDFLFFECLDRQFMLGIGDSEGKGIEAAYNAGKIIHRLQGIVDGNRDAEMNFYVEKLNTRFTPGEDKIASLYIAKFRADGRFAYVNAGHDPAVVIDRKGHTRIWREGNVLLGASKKFSYDSFPKRLFPEDLVFLSTDGFSEAANSEGKIYPEDRRTDILRSMRKAGAKEIVDELKKDALHFTGEEGFSDDALALVVKYRGNQ